MNKVRPMTGVARSIGLTTVTGNGGVEPFVNVSISGLLWGYAGSDVSRYKVDEEQDWGSCCAFMINKIGW